MSGIYRLLLCFPKNYVLHYVKRKKRFGYTISIHAVKEHNDSCAFRKADFSHGKHVTQLALKVN